MRVLFLTLVVAATSAPLLAQPVRLTADQAQLYRSYRLDVEVREYTTYRTEYTVLEARTYPTSVDVRWQGFIGTEPVSEVDFYRHAGREELADRIASRRARGRVFRYTGAAATIGGIVLTFLGFEDSDGDDMPDNEWMQYAGGGATIVGLVMLRSGTQLSRSQYTSPRQAQEAAIQFNTNLEESIRRRRR